jgi:uncharacterized protein (TIGR02246 family)
VKSRTILLLLPLAAFLSSLLPAGLRAAPTGVAEEIRTLLSAQAAAWNRGDLEAFCSVYSDDALFLTPSGLTKGRKAVMDRYRKKYPDAAARGTLSFEVVDVRRIGDAGASVVARWKLAGDAKSAAEGLTLLSFERCGSALRIVHDASM